VLKVTGEPVGRFLPLRIVSEREAQELVERCAPLIREFLAA